MQKSLTVAWVLAVGSFLPWTAQAGLGGDEASVLADAAQLHAGGARIAPKASFDLESISGSPGIEVREYVSRGGIVFAVAWSGPAPPDLTLLLGIHFAEYASALARLTHPGLKRTLAVTTPSGMVVEAGGHLRAYVGRAYLPALVPAGVNIAELR
jgi:Protein of unknown function (DUF2844)